MLKISVKPLLRNYSKCDLSKLANCEKRLLNHQYLLLPKRANISVIRRGRIQTDVDIDLFSSLKVRVFLKTIIHVF